MFNRMKHVLKHAASGAEEVEEDVIQTVARALQPSTVVALSEDGKRVKRCASLDKDPEELAAEIDGRSLIVSPFRFDVGLEELTTFFESVGSVNAVRMRRHVTSKDFRGSVFVEFSTVEESERVLKQSAEEPGYVFDGAPLRMERKTAFIKRKQEERQERANIAGGEREDGDGVDGETAAGGAHEEIDMEALGLKSGTIVTFDFGKDTSFDKEVSFGLIKDSFGGKESGLVYVEYESGEKDGVARFASEENVKAVLEGCENGKRMLAVYEATLKVLEGNEEKEYIKKVVAMRKKKAADQERQAAHQKGKGGRGRGRGRGKRRGSGRGHSNTKRQRS